MIKRIGDFFADKVSKILPDSFIFVILLTIVTIILAVTVAGSGFEDIMKGWVSGFLDSKILMFAIFLIMGLTFGYCIGVSPPFKKVFSFLVKFISKPWQAYLVITIFSMILMLLHYALAPVLALFVVELCKKVRGVDFRIAFAATYAGMLPWHGGFSSSAALFVATEETAKGFIEQGIIKDIIPVSETLLIPMNFILIAACFIVLPIIILLLKPKVIDEKWDAALHYERKQSTEGTKDAVKISESTKRSFADMLNESPIISIFLALLSLLAFVGIMKAKGFNLAALVFIMLTLALLFQWRPINFVNAVKASIRGSADIIIQFPLFGAIMGLFASTGLAVIIAKGLISFADARTLPYFAYLSSSIVNLFIPSGGGEWLVLGAPLLQAANMVGASVGKTIMGFAYGDSITNLINPFWTLAFLPIMGTLMDIKPRDFMGYAAFIFVIFFTIQSIIILLV